MYCDLKLSDAILFVKIQRIAWLGTMLLLLYLDRILNDTCLQINIHSKQHQHS